MLKFSEYTRREYSIPSWIEWTAATLCVAVGTFITLYFGKPNLDRARASTRWPTTDGLVEVSEVGRKTENNGQIRYFTQLRYSYSVDGRHYESKTVWVGDDYFSSSPSPHEEVVRRYPVNARVTVHYDASQPQVAVLEPGLFLSNYGVFVAGLGFIGVGVWVALKALRESRRIVNISARTLPVLLMLSLASLLSLHAADTPLTFADSRPQRYEFSARASEIDPRARPHPKIDFVFEKDGKPADVEHASVDTRVKPQGKLVIWLMGHSAPLFERVNGYGLHAIRVHYANGWFPKFGTNPPPADDKFLGKIRLEAATGQDFSDVVNIPKPDGMMERALQFVKWLAKENPPGRWEYFLTDDGRALRWERVIMAGSSHGSTTAARFAKHQRVDRVVMFCGPRDQFETWQALPSATPPNRFFGFSHVLDDGWKGDHYCRSWELLGLQQFGPVVNVDKSSPPYGNTRRLITDADVKNDAKRAHGSVVPGGSAVKDANGKFLHEDVWRYLFTHPVEEVGQPSPHDSDCTMDLRASAKKAAATQ